MPPLSIAALPMPSPMPRHYFRRLFHFIFAAPMLRHFRFSSFAFIDAAYVMLLFSMFAIGCRRLSICYAITPLSADIYAAIRHATPLMPPCHPHYCHYCCRLLRWAFFGHAMPPP